MESSLVKQTLKKRIKSMLEVDFKRMFSMPLIYIMAGISFIIPILILVMTSSLSGTHIDPITGVETTIEGFSNVWQSIGSLSNSSATSMDLVSMCNINLIYFLIVVFVSIFINDDYKSGYVKNLFTSRSKKSDYVISKTTIGFVSGIIMIIAYFIGSMIGGKIAGLSFDIVGFGRSGIIMCMISKMFLVLVFAGICVLMGVLGKQRAWLSIICSFACSMLIFTMIPIITPLNSTFLNVILCLIGGGIFATGLGAISNLILNKKSIL